MAEAKAIGYLDLNINGLEQALSTAKKLVAGFAASFGAIKLEQFFEKGITGAIKLGDEMYKASQKAGQFDPGNLLLVQKALEATGESAQSALGIIDDALKDGRQISSIFNGSDNYAKALDNAAKSYGSQAKVLSSSAEKLSKVWETLQAVGSKIQTFFLSLTAQFVKPLQATLDYLNQIDLAGVGETFGKYLADAANTLIGAFQSGTLFDLVEIGFKLAFEESTNYLMDKINAFVKYVHDGLGETFFNAVEMLGKALNAVFGSTLFNTITTAFVAVGAKIIAVLLRAFDTPIRYFKAGLQQAIESVMESLGSIPGIGKALGLDQFKGQSFDKTLAEQGDSTLFGNSAKDYDKAADELFDKSQQGITDLVSTFFSEFNNQKIDTNKVFQTDELKAQFNKLLDDAKKKGESLSNAADVGKIKKNESIKGDPQKIIADSLARVGGGGRFIRQGQTLLEKQAMLQTKALQENLQVNKQIAQNTAKGPNKFINQ